ncbi:MAG: DUF362 domain-containing protein [Candidatus Latescibacteria bacterium]|nr:DUF362 domain-containing protein [Candidatus Latescibacterota bacterium]
MTPENNTNMINKLPFDINNRRTFLKLLTGSMAVSAFDTFTAHGFPFSGSPNTVGTTVSFVTGEDRRENIYKVLEPFINTIKEQIRGKQVIIKPNLVGKETILCATHPDAIRGVLDFLKPLYKKTIWIAESTGRRYKDMPGTIKHYHLYDYFPLEKEFNVKLVDLNTHNYQRIWVLGKEGHPMDIRIIDDFLNPNNYIISLCRIKTHNCMVVSLTAKNMLMGAPLVDDTRHDKGRMHTVDVKRLNYNLYLLAQKVQPQLAILDGLEGMEGNGPTAGTGIHHGVAVAGTDFIAVDRVGCLLMGVPFEDVGYLTYCADSGVGQGDLEKIKIIGPDPAKFVKTYKLHDNFERMMEWKN